MDGYRTHFVWIIILCLVQDYGSCSKIIEGPKNATVLSGSDPSFSCTVESGWKSISWMLQDIFEVSVIPTGTTVTKDNIIAQNSTNSFNGAFTSMITIVNVQKADSGLILCSSLSAASQSAYLSVQVSGSLEITNGNVIMTPNSTVNMICRAAQWYPAPTIKWQINNTLVDASLYSIRITEATDFMTAESTFKITTDQNLSLTCLASIEALTQPKSATVNITVKEDIPGSSSSLSQTDIILIAVFASLGGLLLLIIIIVIIIFCCKKKKKKKKKKTESGYQSDAWKVPEKKNNSPWTIDTDSLGEHNFAYMPDPVSEQQSFGSIDRNSSHYDVASTLTASSLQDPAQKWSNTNTTDDYLKTIRHLTHV